ncbi:hypothetical protein DRQ20_00655 [bacterium]|nr:MAG: hypothetical protein DRQ20_00655 [bacterium]
MTHALFLLSILWILPSATSGKSVVRELMEEWAEIDRRLYENEERQKHVFEEHKATAQSLREAYNKTSDPQSKMELKRQAHENAANGYRELARLKAEEAELLRKKAKQAREKWLNGVKGRYGSAYEKALRKIIREFEDEDNRKREILKHIKPEFVVQITKATENSVVSRIKNWLGKNRGGSRDGWEKHLLEMYQRGMVKSMIAYAWACYYERLAEQHEDEAVLTTVAILEEGMGKEEEEELPPDGTEGEDPFYPF